jgi:four helix bundle protein
MPYEPMESKRIYRRAEAVADQFWDMIVAWEWFAKRTVGMQLARAADSIGANIAEAGGRFHPADVRNFFFFARGSLRETKFWLRRGLQRGLIPLEKATRLDQELEQLAREISQCLNYQKQRISHSQPPSHLTT